MSKRNNMKIFEKNDLENHMLPIVSSSYKFPSISSLLNEKKHVKKYYSTVHNMMYELAKKHSSVAAVYVVGALPELIRTVGGSPGVVPSPDWYEQKAPSKYKYIVDKYYGGCFEEALKENEVAPGMSFKNIF